MKILIVDDIAVNRKLLRAMLEAEGHTTLEAGDGVEALQVLNREKMDAVVSDILMPRMDGYRLCHEIRTNQRLRDLPIVIYTSTYIAATDEKLAFDLGADRYVKKPSPVGIIVAALHEAIAMQHSVPQCDALQQVEVLKEYSDRLVSKLEEKNIELEERLRLTGLSMDVTTALMQGNTLPESLQRCCEAFVRHLDAAFARIWTLNEAENVLELQASAGIYTHLNGPHRTVHVGQFKIGLIAAERKPHLTNSVIGDPRVPEQEWARREGLVAFAGYPLVLENRLVGVLAVFARCALSGAVLDKMASIADAVALGIRRKQAEKELRIVHEELAEANQRLTLLDRCKSEFLSLISHELRTPLNGIFGVGELILDQLPSTDENDELHAMFQQSRRRLLSIVEDALLLVEIDVSGEQFKSVPVSLSVVLSRAVESVAEFADSRQVTVTPPPIDLGLVRGDEVLLVRAFHALIETAVKFSRQGETVQLSRGCESDSPKVIIVSCGRTIPSSALEHFFDCFSTGETMTPGGNLGLAAPVACRILSLFGASVSVANQESSGIRLTISLQDIKQSTSYTSAPLSR